ncbi:hypothetical protein ACJX0J_007148, partial [Zea mays]
KTWLKGTLALFHVKEQIRIVAAAQVVDLDDASLLMFFGTLTCFLIHYILHLDYFINLCASCSYIMRTTSFLCLLFHDFMYVIAYLFVCFVCYHVYLFIRNMFEILLQIPFQVQILSDADHSVQDINSP